MELKASDVLEVFQNHYFLHNSAITISDMHFTRENGNVRTVIVFAKNGEETKMEAVGNGSLDAVAAVLDKGYRTADIWSDELKGCKKVGCKEMGQRIIENLRKE